MYRVVLEYWIRYCNYAVRWKNTRRAGKVLHIALCTTKHFLRSFIRCIQPLSVIFCIIREPVSHASHHTSQHTSHGEPTYEPCEPTYEPCKPTYEPYELIYEPCEPIYEPCEPHTSHASQHTSYVSQHTSHVSQHTSHVSQHKSHVSQHTNHTSQLRVSQLAIQHASHASQSFNFFMKNKWKLKIIKNKIVKLV